MALRRWITVGVMFTMALTTTLVGCAASGASAAQTPLSAASPTPSPTLSQVAEPSPSPTSAGTAHTCTAVAGSSRLGDLAISAPSALYGFNADYMLPDGLPTDKPLTVTLQDNAGYVLGGAIESRPVVQAAFVMSVCNTSSAHAHRLTSFGVMLDWARPHDVT